MTYKMFDKDLEEMKIDDGSRGWGYLYIENFEEFCSKYGDDWILDGIEEDGLYEYDDDVQIWRKITNKIISKEILDKVNNKKRGWNIIITLDTGDKIQTNTVPVSMEDVQEAIGVLVKPSILGMRIKSFEIVAE